uniref:Uncharacterized protein n=1 Tax=Cacopsylla melanoneura TaxID=428564 RepID=A0A8D8UBP3_9HEMI
MALQLFLMITDNSVNCKNCKNCPNSTNCVNSTNLTSCTDCVGSSNSRSCVNCRNVNNCVSCTNCTNCTNCKNNVKWQHRSLKLHEKHKKGTILFTSNFKYKLCMYFIFHLELNLHVQVHTYKKS